MFLVAVAAIFWVLALCLSLLLILGVSLIHSFYTGVVVFFLFKFSFSLLVWFGEYMHDVFVFFLYTIISSRLFSHLRHLLSHELLCCVYHHRRYFRLFCNEYSY